MTRIVQLACNWGHIAASMEHSLRHCGDAYWLRKENSSSFLNLNFTLILGKNDLAQAVSRTNLKRQEMIIFFRTLLIKSLLGTIRVEFLQWGLLSAGLRYKFFLYHFSLQVVFYVQKQSLKQRNFGRFISSRRKTRFSLISNKFKDQLITIYYHFNLLIINLIT